MNGDFNINIDLGVAEALKMAQSIIEKRKERGTNFFLDLCDQLDVLKLLVKEFDDLFIKLATAYTDNNIINDESSLKSLNAENMKYLTGRNLLPVLEELAGELNGIAYDPKFRDKKYSELILTLRNLCKRIREFRNNLGRGAHTFVGSNEEYNLMSLWEKANDQNAHPEFNLKELANEVFRNHDFDLSDSIFHLCGKVKAQAKSIYL